MYYCPFRHFPLRVTPKGFVRLACLIHAANVRSEPGSNPSKIYACPWVAPKNLAGIATRDMPRTASQKSSRSFRI
jgi:hypothetical protein